MCGIVGHYRYEAGAPLPSSFDRLINTLRHRGPDDSTYWDDDRFAFGHRRLSIIDLGGGRQPMATEDGSLVVTFNGEIYNYIELRDELAARGCRFRTSSDTEVLLHGYREWGSALPAKLTGMFAFAVADRRKQELFLARDRFGEKPLLYREEPGAVTFASELAPLNIFGAPRSLDLEALGRYLCMNYVPGEATLIRQIRRLPPASWRRYSPGGRVETGKYFALPDGNQREHVSFDDAVVELESTLDNAVRLTLRSDVPVGLFLSAGIDSSLVAHSAARAGYLSRAFCLGFDDRRYSEVDGAARVAHQLGIPLTTVTLTAKVFDDFLDIVRHADDPLGDSSALAVWTIAREAARHVKVVLSGDGGDEMFGGYLTHRASLWHAAVTTHLPHSIRRGLRASASRLPTSESKVSATYKMNRYLRAADLPASRAHFSWNGAWMPQQAAALVRSSDEARTSAADALNWMASRHSLSDPVTLEAVQRADIGDYLPNDILLKSDRMSMAHGLEVRAPFLNEAIAGFALRLPSAHKAGLRGRGKRVLRALAGRKYGVNVANARKQGFSVPIHAWLRGPARPLAEDLLSTESVARVEPLDAAAVSDVLSEHLAGRRSYGFELLGLMVLVAWHRQNLQGAPQWPPSEPPPQRLQLTPESARASAS